MLYIKLQNEQEENEYEYKHKGIAMRGRRRIGGVRQ